MRVKGRKGTFSIVAVDTSTGEIGCAVQSRYFAVGNVVPWARAGVGAVATQAAGVAVFGPRILDLLASGLGPEEAIAAVLADDDGRETRQLGVVAADGSAAAHTGSECLAWAGHRTGAGLRGPGEHPRRRGRRRRDGAGVPRDRWRARGAARRGARSRAGGRRRRARAAVGGGRRRATRRREGEPRGTRPHLRPPRRRSSGADRRAATAARHPPWSGTPYVRRPHSTSGGTTPRVSHC